MGRDMCHKLTCWVHATLMKGNLQVPALSQSESVSPIRESPSLLCGVWGVGFCYYSPVLITVTPRVWVEYEFLHHCKWLQPITADQNPQPRFHSKVRRRGNGIVESELEEEPSLKDSTKDWTGLQHQLQDLELLDNSIKTRIGPSGHPWPLRLEGRTAPWDPFLHADAEDAYSRTQLYLAEDAYNRTQLYFAEDIHGFR